jgi:cobalt transporter subunit CbtA
VIHRVLAVALIAGLLTGLATAALQQFVTTPLIHIAETYEAAHAAEAHGGEAAADWKPAEGVERIAATSLATIGASVGYALLLLAAMLFANESIEPRRALAWGLAGFGATGLATGMGLAPQLPGAAEAALAARQFWWVGAALATALGLYLLLRQDRAPLKALGALSIAAPHLWGAPRATSFESAVPAELAARFAASSLAVQAVTWALLGVSVGLAWEALRRRSAGEASVEG